MRILTFTHLFPNSLQPVWGVFIYQRIAHLAKRPGIEVTVVAPVPYIPKWIPIRSWEKYKHIPKEEIIGGVSAIHPRYPHIPKIAMPLHGILLFLGCYRQVAKLHRERGFDCIDSHWIYPDGFAAVLIGKKLGIPVFCSARGTDINVYPKFWTIRPLISWLLNQSTGIIAVSRALKEVMVNLGLQQEKIRVVGNGVDESRFAPMDRSKARGLLRLPSDGQIMVAVGSLSEHKNHALLISATSVIISRWPDMQLYILGEGPFRERLERMVRDKGLQGRVLLPGNQSNEKLNLWYNAADVSCLSSCREGWPNVLMESLACGTPVVATRVGGVPEVITSAAYGLLVEQSVPALAKGMESALGNQWDREAIVRYARTRTWNEVAAEIESYFVERMAARHF
jgi:glycosyltransferase involved in cell wall biosynthesis